MLNICHQMQFIVPSCSSNNSIYPPQRPHHRAFLPHRRGKDLIDGQKMLIVEVFLLNREHFLMTCEVFLLIDGLIYLIDEVIYLDGEVKMPEL